MKKTHLTLKKLQQKVSQRFIVVLGVLNKISKVYPNLTMQKIFKMADKMAAEILFLGLIWYIM